MEVEGGVLLEAENRNGERGAAEMGKWEREM